mmetsp:Transcript_23064/g.46269  ORF Transcript_23064/g.46269 Transcript_23064/m.46269 type:complete len:200 (-) Transcript_23064:1379-1978(-)
MDSRDGKQIRKIENFQEMGKIEKNLHDINKRIEKIEKNLCDTNKRLEKIENFQDLEKIERSPYGIDDSPREIEKDLHGINKNDVGEEGNFRETLPCLQCKFNCYLCCKIFYIIIRDLTFYVSLVYYFFRLVRYIQKRAPEINAYYEFRQCYVHIYGYNEVRKLLGTLSRNRILELQNERNFIGKMIDGALFFLKVIHIW